MTSCCMEDTNRKDPVASELILSHTLLYIISISLAYNLKMLLLHDAVSSVAIIHKTVKVSKQPLFTVRIAGNRPCFINSFLNKHTDKFHSPYEFYE